MADGFQAEKGGDVDDAQATHLHEAAAHFRSAGHQFSAHVAHVYHVVRHEGRTAFNQAQGRFTLPHAALAADEDAHTAHVHHAAVQGDAFREFVFQNDGGGVDEFHGHQARAEDADAGFIRQLHDFPRGNFVTGEDDARHLAPEHALNARFAHAFRQFLKIGQLRGAENLDTFVGKVGVEAGRSPARGG